MSTTPLITFSLRSILEKDKLNGSNFLDWYRNLRIVLRQERKDYVLTKVLPDKLRSNASHAERDAWNKHYDDAVDVVSLMLASMDSDLRKQYEKMESPVEMITSLKEKFQGLARVERYQTVKSLLECRLQEGRSVGQHIIKMMGYLDNLAKLDSPFSQRMATYIILHSLPSSYDHFVAKYKLNNSTGSVTELCSMLKAAEPNIKKGAPNVLLVHKDKRFKKPGKDIGRDKTNQVENLDWSGSSSKSESGPSDVGMCRYCNDTGHVERNCIKYLEDSEEIKKMYGTSSSGTYVMIVIVTIPGSDCWYWILAMGLIFVLMCRTQATVERWSKNKWICDME